MQTLQHDERTVAADPMVPRFVPITDVVEETRDTFTLQLDTSEWEGGCAFEPGQFNMLYVFGVGEVPISISGDPAVGDTLLHTTRVVGNVTSAMRRLDVGDRLGVRGPYGRGWPMEEAEGKDVMIVTGGIGLAPLRPAIYHVLNYRERYGKVAILYGARTPDDMLYPEELQRLRGRLDLEVDVTVDRGGRDWFGNVGVVTTLIPRAPVDPANAIALVCGPEVMMRFTVMALQKCGLRDDQIHISMERNMKCAIGFCGHCQFGPKFVCKDGPVFRFDEVAPIFGVREF